MRYYHPDVVEFRAKIVDNPLHGLRGTTRTVNNQVELGPGKTVHNFHQSLHVLLRNIDQIRRYVGRLGPLRHVDNRVSSRMSVQKLKVFPPNSVERDFVTLLHQYLQFSKDFPPRRQSFSLIKKFQRS